MHRYEVAVLRALKSRKQLSLEELIDRSGLSRDELLWAVENLSKSDSIKVRRSPTESAKLTEEGREYVLSGMPEERLLARVSKRSVNINELRSKEEQIGLQWAKKHSLIAMEAGSLRLTERGMSALREGVEEGRALHELNDNPGAYEDLSRRQSEVVSNLSKRGLIEIKKRMEMEGVSITQKGINELKGAPGSSNEIEALNKNIIVNRSWVGKEFKPYDVNVPVEAEPIAIRHPLRRIIKEVMSAYASMGFKQVSGPIIEPAFWVFDSLFVPQDHPARELQDTFYLSKPETVRIGAGVYLDNVKKTHLESWGGDWSIKAAEQAVLRTHTTNVSVRHVNRIMESLISRKAGYEFPLKLFSLGRVFRNENIDYKHLADFYMTDGIIIGADLTLANLFETIISIYKTFGIEVKFKPAYFPFVEPGAEVYAYFREKKEWIEMGGSGILRREVTGMHRKRITVLAWGLGIDRLLLLKDPSLKSVSELYNNSVGWLRKRSTV